MDTLNGQSLLVVLTGSLGDLVRGFAIISPLKRAYPELKITWLVEDKWLSITKHIKGIDNILVFERKQGFAGVRKIFRELKEQHFDIVLDMQRHFKSGCFSFFSGAKRRIGFHPQNAKEFNFLFNNEFVELQARDYPKIYHYMKFVEKLGVAWQEPLDFGFDIQEERGDTVALILGSSKPEKDWVLENYIELAKYLIEDCKREVILLGDKTQVNNAEKILTALPNTPITSYAGKTDLVELTKLLARSACAIGPDSGPGHISAAVGTPYLSLFGPTEIRRVAPYKAGHLAIQTASNKVSDITVHMVKARLKDVGIQ